MNTEMLYAIVVLEIAGLVGLSALFSGLNISFMSLQVRDLRNKAKLGDKNAAKMLPLREKSHLTLAAILYANVGAVTATGLVLSTYTGGLIAGIISTFLLVIFGEILPQAYFMRNALAINGFFAPLMRLVVILTYPVSKPTQVLLDKILPKEEGALHSRAELGLLIHEYKGVSPVLDDDEVEIIQGALKLSETRVSSIMEPIKNVFWLRENTILDEKTVDIIKAYGFSRIPVFDRALTKCYGVLLVKDMLDIDFDEEPVPILDFDLHQTKEVGSRTALDTALRDFLNLPTHLVPIEKNGKIVGILTMEDLLEEIVGHEIVDETDRALARE